LVNVNSNLFSGQFHIPMLSSLGHHSPFFARKAQPNMANALLVMWTNQKTDCLY